MRFYLFVFFLVLGSTISAQVAQDTNAPYFEDQFYLGLSYNFIRNNPSGSTERSLSYGFMGGFIKDIPLNNTGTFAVGFGTGLSVNSYYSNLIAKESQNAIIYSLDDNIQRSKLETYLVEFPLELRLRNSTASEYKFWRVYAGIKGGYVIAARSKVVTENYNDSFYNTDITPFQYGLTISLGYDTINFHAYYSLTNIFDGKASLANEVLDYSPLRIGVILYIL